MIFIFFQEKRIKTTGKKIMDKPWRMKGNGTMIETSWNKNAGKGALFLMKTMGMMIENHGE